VSKVRADQLLVSRGLAESRTKAQALIMAGAVFSGEKKLAKPGDMLAEDAPLEVRGKDHPWVSRGGIKLAHGIDHFGFDVTGAVALDIGSSTGGFTDVLLSRGAAKVYAIDVGTNQLAWKLRQDPRVIVHEQTNARHLDSSIVPEPVDIVTCDASFISLAKVLESPLKLARRAPGWWPSSSRSSRLAATRSGRAEWFGTRRCTSASAPPRPNGSGRKGGAFWESPEARSPGLRGMSNFYWELEKMVEAASRSDWWRYALVTVPAIVLLGSLSGWLSNSGYGNPWFDALDKPFFMPPGWVFGVVWPVLYALLGIAAAVILAEPPSPARKKALILFFVQLALNFAWSPLFFAAQAVTIALVTIFAMTAIAAMAAGQFWRIRRVAGALMLPYLAWLCFAAALNAAIGRLNPGAGALLG
jgi:TlyA family rRNA methyltransferase/putative hemolysin